MKLLAILLFPILMFGQTEISKSNFKAKVDSAYTNALKGIYFAIENIPERKNSVSKDLILNNELIAKIKISKETGGVYVQSIGFYKTYKVTTEIYRDYKSLKNDGTIDYIPR